MMNLEVKHFHNNGHYTDAIIYRNEMEIGHCHFESETKGSITLTHLVIYEEYQNQGYGQFLLTECLSHLKTCNISNIKLRVDKTLLNAVHIYEKLGFKIICERYGYYFMSLTFNN